MKIAILGIHDGHDASACLVQGGRIVHAIAEERLRNIKHWRGVPQKAIEFCIKEGNPDIVAIAGVYRRYGRFKALQDLLRQYEIPVSYWSHHRCHAASFYTSGFKEALVVSMDAGGDGFSMVAFQGSQDQGLVEIKQSSIYESLGTLYSEVTESLGFQAMSEEGKTMALAAYGQPVENILHFYDQVASWNPTYQSFISRVSYGTAELRNRLNQHRKQYKWEDIAASIQYKLEKEVIKFLKDILTQISTQNLCLTGGVFHNAQLALKLHQTFPELNHWIFPAPGDAGLSIGAALLEYFRQSNDPVPPQIQHVFWGPPAPSTLKKVPSNLQISSVAEGSLIKRIEELIYQEKAIIGLCRGEIEFGPRALGHRSLLARCDIPEMKELLNQRKGRQKFQPFAPIIIHEEAENYLEDYFISPFMTRAFKVTPKMEQVAPAVIHRDHTSRIQSITSDDPDQFTHKLLKYCYQETGIPLLLNTSFNLHGFPLVQNQEDLWNALQRGLCDVIVLGTQLIEKS